MYAQFLVLAFLVCQSTAWEFAKAKILKKNLAAAAVIASSRSSQSRSRATQMARLQVRSGLV
jgi:hypothetical protein